MGDLGNKINSIPGDIKCLLTLLIERKVTLILKNDCEPQHVEIENVIGDLVVVNHDKQFRFISIACICEVIVCCSELLEALLDKDVKQSSRSSNICCTDAIKTEVSNDDTCDSEDTSNNCTSNSVWKSSFSAKPKHKQMRC